MLKQVKYLVECGCRYELVFVYAEKRALEPRRNHG